MNKSIAVAGTGYVGLSLSVLLAQHNHVTAVDIIPEKVALINKRKSTIQDEYIEKYLAEKELDLTATTDGASAYPNLCARNSITIILFSARNFYGNPRRFMTIFIPAGSLFPVMRIPPKPPIISLTF